MKYGDMLRLSPTLYHSGLSSDVERVLRFFLETQQLESVALIGYSMGGNLVLKLAGDLGDAAPSQLHSVVGVSPAVDLEGLCRRSARAAEPHL
jgi:predicted alpha/beta-fold hydrolase